MDDILRWIFVAAVVALVIGLVAAARGPEHHRGQHEGDQAAVMQVVG
jgi:hypothetical protein